MSFIDRIRKSFRKRSIKSIAASILLMFLLLYGVNSYIIFSRSVSDFRLSQSISHMNTISDYLFTAVANLGFERGRVNVVLNSTEDPSGMGEHRSFILERREDGEEALDRALSLLAENDSQDYTSETEHILMIQKDVNAFRRLAARNLEAAWEERDQQLAEVWFARMTDYIESIESLLAGISQGISDSDGVVSRYFSIKLRTLALRNSAGPEISILAAGIHSGKPLKDELSLKILTLQTETNEIFKDLDYLAGTLKGSQLSSSLIELENAYYGSFKEVRNTVYQEALTGGPYSYTQEKFLLQGVDILQQIAGFMDVVVQQTSDYTTAKYLTSRKNILNYSVFSFLSLFFVMVVFLLVNSRILKQTNILTDIIVRLGRKEKDVIIPNLSSLNEIGDMSRAVEVFKNTLIALDQHILELEQISRDKEDLIVELRQALEEVKALREIIPICSYCKKIRNDQGYFESVEQYFSKHSDTDFSHTICPDCIRKYFPDLEDKMNSRK